MSKIKSIKSREILASGGKPTIETEVVLESGAEGLASVPYGASAGVHEAVMLRDEDKNRYGGAGVLKAIENVHQIIAPELIGMEAENQREIDSKMIELDGTDNKANLGGNAILSVSLAVAKAMAAEKQMPLYKYIREAFELDIDGYYLPNPMMVIIEGGKHAHNSTDLQEFIVSTYGFDSAKENIRMGEEIYMALKKHLKSLDLNTNVGNEGAFAPSGLGSNEKPLELIVEAIKLAGYEPGKDAGISLDAAASEFFEDGSYNLTIEAKELSSAELIDYYMPWFEKYPIVTVEDMLHEDDWEFWPKFTEKCPVPNIGDDLLVTNVERLERAIKEKACDAVLVKLNQIGSLSETIDCCMLARENGMMTVPSHRGGGEVNDTSMVDVAVAVNAGFIKVGPARGERVCKYNRLMEIEAELGDKAKVQGADFASVK
ncbi:phosphopyruvate hydratase [Candidatus Dojkabacteria bacterium]|nr:phosphopyruvate hydratase [Candidatus Dojkabacteria bacterium]